jgi:hypothetical protein
MTGVPERAASELFSLLPLLSAVVVFSAAGFWSLLDGTSEAGFSAGGRESADALRAPSAADLPFPFASECNRVRLAGGFSARVSAGFPSLSVAFAVLDSAVALLSPFASCGFSVGLPSGLAAGVTACS